MATDPDVRIRELEATVRVLTEENVVLEQRVEETEQLERLRMAIDQAPEVIVITDTDGTVTYVNPAFERVSGYRLDEAIGQKASLQKSGEHGPAFYRALWETISSGRTWSGRFVNRRKDGTTYTEGATISPVYAPTGGIVNYVAVKRDITAELELEAQLRQAQKMESVGRLAGGIAHDFNNLLSPILGYAELLLMDVHADDPRHEDLAGIVEAANRARNLTRHMLAFSRRQVLQMRTVSLAEIVSEFAKVLRASLREDVELQVHLASTQGMIKADTSQLEQVLMNLAVNAQDAMPMGGKLIIEVLDVLADATYAAKHPGVSPGAWVRFSVTDTGIGMDEPTRERVFEPFFTTKEPGKGTGLGLATVYGIVKQHHGAVEVYSTPGSGTRFELHFPRVTDASQRVVREERRVAPMRGGETILVVDDESMVRRLACRILEASGYRVLEAHDAAHCQAILQRTEQTVDLLLTDVVMPGTNGRELYTSLVQRHSDLRVVYMSGYSDDVIANHGVVDEDVVLLQKPLTVDNLTRTVRQVLDQ